MIYIIDNGGEYSDQTIYFLKCEHDMDAINTLLKLFKTLHGWRECKVIGVGNIEFKNNFQTMDMKDFIDNEIGFFDLNYEDDYKIEEARLLFSVLPDDLKKLLSKQIINL